MTTEQTESYKISLLTAIIININIMIGAGVYINPPLMAQKAGTLSYLGWVIAGLIFLPLVLSISKISALFPGEGSFFNYSKKGLGDSAGFLSGWLYFLGYVGVSSTQMLAFRDVLAYQLNIQMVQQHPILFNLVFFAFFCTLSFFSLRAVGAIQSVMTIFKLLPIFFLILFLFVYYFQTKFATITQLISTDNSLFDLRYTLPLAIFGFWGFECCCSFSHLIKGGRKSAGRAVLIGFLFTVIISTLFHAGLIQLMGTNNLIALEVPAFVKFLRITSVLLLSIISFIITSAIMSSYVSAIYGALNSYSFLLNAMAKKKLLFFSSFLSKLNRYKKPTMAIIAQGLIAFLFVTLINNKHILVAITNIGILSAFLFTLISLIRLQFQKKIYSGIISPVFGIASCGILGFYSWATIGSIYNIIPLLALTLIGFIIFKIQYKKMKGAHIE